MNLSLLDQLPHGFFLAYFFALGACVGSFLNVVVWRLPRGESLIRPPSHCPKCNTPLRWFDNIPIFGWILLLGKCRYCGQRISIRYPLVEFFCGAMFGGLYWALFVRGMGPGGYRPLLISHDWPLLILYLTMLGGLLAASLIDAEHFIIPIEIAWLLAAVGIITHALIDGPYVPGTLSASPITGVLAAGGAVGLIISIVLLQIGWLPQSFADGAPMLEVDKAKIAAEIPAEFAVEVVLDQPIEPVENAPAEIATDDEHEEADQFPPSRIRAEMRKEILFLLPPLLLAAGALFFYSRYPNLQTRCDAWMSRDWLSGLLGAIWGALIGAWVVWFTRIAGSFAFGREAMGLGDVHLMFGVGAIIGAAGVTFAFFIAPFIGLALAFYKLATRRGRELPYGPFLSMATVAVVLFYGRIIQYLTPSVRGLSMAIQQKLSGP